MWAGIRFWLMKWVREKRFSEKIEVVGEVDPNVKTIFD